MTDISSIRTHADPQLTPVAPFSPAPPVLPNGHVQVDPSLEDEESSTIKCICGFQDDDGHTVLCEKCNTWQHIACYYESVIVPEIHECADCFPRSVDVKGATERQRQRIRELSSVGERRVKKPAAKSHKKKIKETTATILTNGWPADKHDSHYGADRKSGSPREQPPAKRPKTSHKSSASVSTLGNGPVLPSGRKRAHSNAANGMSPTKSPTSTISNGYTADYFSPEFLQLYRQGDPKEMHENSYSDIGLTNDLTNWLEDPEALAEVTEGMQPQQIFSRVDSFEDLEHSAPVIVENVDEDQSISTPNGLYPVWHYLTVDSHVPPNGYIGELTGHVCRKKDYCSAPSNRWERLRHPEPFVFFPPHLPIAIDSRKGGTRMRYARRSCDPNMTLRIFITEGIYHFCFVSTREIEPGQELTVPWDVDPDLKRLLGTVLNNGNIQKEGIRGVDQVVQWVAGVLSNFGGCACNRPKGDCLLERADRRNGTYQPDYAGHAHKMSKSRKQKKQQASPLSTGHATNSRAGSEAIKVADQDEDNADTRSVSGSTRSKPGSRDITPMTHISNDPTVGLGVELSDREKRKLMQSERLFEQLEYDEQHGHRRKKRNSAGSTLNTPSATTSKQLGHPDQGIVSTTTRARSATNGQRMNGTHPRSSNRVMKPPQKPRPVYVDTATQTDDDPTVGPLSNSSFIRRNRIPFYRQLLNRARDERLRREAQVQARLDKDAASPSSGSQPASPSSAVKEDVPMVDSPAAESKVPAEEMPSSEAAESIEKATLPPPPPTPPNPPAGNPPKAEERPDVEMKDAEETTVSPAADFRKPDPPPTKQPCTASSSTQESHPPTQPPAPPWPATPASPATPTTSTTEPTSSTPPTSKPNNLRVDLPPPPDFSSAQFSAATQTATPSSSTASLTGLTAESPSTATASSAPLFSPAVGSAVTPTPTSKRLSLSDFLARQKAKKQEAELQAQATHATISEGIEETAPGQAGASAVTDASKPDGNVTTAAPSDAPKETFSPVAKDVEMKDIESPTKAETGRLSVAASTNQGHKAAPSLPPVSS